MKKIVAALCLALIAVSSVSAQGGSAIQENCASASSTESAETRSGEPLHVDLYFELPEFVEAGLANGSLERVGGIIRYSDDKRIIAWLRQVGLIGQVAESTTSLLEHAIRLSGTKFVAFGKLIAGATPFLNISMAGYSLVEHIAGIRIHEAELERIYDRVSEEFQRDREVEMLAALDHAENALVARCAEFKLEAVAQVSFELTVAQAQLVRDLDELLSAEMNKENSELATIYQVLAMKVCTMSTRLRLEIGEDAAAIHWLSKCVEEHKAYARKFVRKWVGERPALYFHESVSDEYFERYLDIERWLQGEEDVLADVVKMNRRYFWDNEALQPLDAPTIGFQIDEDPFYLDAIPNAELLIENFQRLSGYELELTSMPLPFSEWDAYEEARLDNHDGYILLVNSDALTE